MADVTTITLNVQTKDASENILDTIAKSFGLAPDEFRHMRVACPITTGVDIDISNFTAVTCLVVVNEDPTNFVNVTHDNAAAATVVTKVLKEGSSAPYMTPDIDPSATFNITADTGACVCDVFICGT